MSAPARQGENRRRSQRIPLAVPLIVSGRDPTISFFSEECRTRVVNAHGSAIRTPIPLRPRAPLRLQIPGSYRSTTAHVVGCNPAEPDTKAWDLTVELDAPGNFWAVEFPPGDWPSPKGEAGPTLHQLHDVVEEQLGKIGEAIRKQMLLSRDQVLQQTRQELRGLAAEMRQQLGQEATPYVEAGAKIEAQLDEVRNFRDYLESLLRLLPETLDQRLEKGVAAAAERLQARMEEEIAARTPANVWLACSRALPKLEEQLWATLQQRLEGDFDRRRTQLQQALERARVQPAAGAASDRQTLPQALETAREKLARLEDQVEKLVTDLGTEVNWAVAEARLRSLAIYEEVLGSEHPTMAQALENYSVLLRQMGREVEAQKTEARAKAIRAQPA